MLKKIIIYSYIGFIFICIKVFCSIFFIKTKNTWLISERGFEAKDNAFVLYSYIKKEHPNTNVKYVIHKNSSDRLKIMEGDIINFGSLKHFYYFFLCEALISTHVHGYSPKMNFFKKVDMIKLFHTRGKKIYLQHGVSKDKPVYNINNQRLDGYVFAVKKEYESFSSETGYPKSIMWKTGFPRFDHLSKDSKETKNVVLIMPTWRLYMSNISEKQFLETEYYKRFQELINFDELICELEKRNFKIIFYPHHEVQKFISCFSSFSPSVDVLDRNKANVQDLLITSRLLITDYSSVFFDFAYLDKDTIFYQFDKEEYRKNHYSEGWFSYEEDGPGPIATDLNQLKKLIINSLEKRNDSTFLKRVENMFFYRDTKNSERVYNKILEITSRPI